MGEGVVACTVVVATAPIPGVHIHIPAQLWWLLHLFLESTYIFLHSCGGYCTYPWSPHTYSCTVVVATAPIPGVHIHIPAQLWWLLHLFLESTYIFLHSCGTAPIPGYCIYSWSPHTYSCTVVVATAPISGVHIHIPAQLWWLLHIFLESTYIFLHNCGGHCTYPWSPHTYSCTVVVATAPIPRVHIHIPAQLWWLLHLSLESTYIFLHSCSGYCTYPWSPHTYSCTVVVATAPIPGVHIHIPAQLWWLLHLFLESTYIFLHSCGGYCTYPWSPHTYSCTVVVATAPIPGVHIHIPAQL